MSAVDFALWWGFRYFIPGSGVRVPFAFLGLTFDVTVGRGVVQRAPYRCSRTFSLRRSAVALKLTELLVVVAPHFSWFPCGCNRSSITGNLAGVAWSRQAVDVKVSHHGCHGGHGFLHTYS